MGAEEVSHNVHECATCHLPTVVDVEHWSNLGFKPCKEGHHKLVLFAEDEYSATHPVLFSHGKLGLA